MLKNIKSWRLPKWMNLDAVKTPHCIGLDFGTASVKMVELKRVKKEMKLVGYASASYPANTWNDQGAQNMEAIIATIQTCYEKLNTKTKHVALAMPPHDSIIKHFKMTAGLTEEQQRMSAEKDVESQLPFSLDRASWDWTANVPKSKDESFEATWGATLTEAMQDRVGLVEAAGLKVSVLECEAFSQARILEHISKESRGAVLLVDIGEKMLNLTVLTDRVCWVREISFFRKQFDETWQQKLGVSDEAFHAGRKDAKDDFAAAVDEQVTHLAEDVLRGLSEYHPAPGEDVTAIILCGGGAGLPLVAEKIEMATYKSVSIMDPLNGIENSGSVKHGSFTFSVAAGLALRTFDPARSLSSIGV
jgi:type IV pilus assembly protein PilM